MKQLVAALVMSMSLATAAAAEDRVLIWTSNDDGMTVHVYPGTATFDFENPKVDARGVIDVVQRDGSTNRFSIAVGGCGSALGDLMFVDTSGGAPSKQTWVRGGKSGWDTSAKYLCDRFHAAYQARR